MRRRLGSGALAGSHLRVLGVLRVRKPGMEDWGSWRAKGARDAKAVGEWSACGVPPSRSWRPSREKAGNGGLERFARKGREGCEGGWGVERLRCPTFAYLACFA